MATASRPLRETHVRELTPPAAPGLSMILAQQHVEVLDAIAEIACALSRVEARLQQFETYVQEAKDALENMPPLPFMPKFGKRTKGNNDG